MKQILEVQVNKENEKGAPIFEHILIVLHKILDKKPSWYFKKTEITRPEFSFEIVKYGNKIRFFLIWDKKYTNFLINQIYAHFPNVEISPIADYLQSIPENKMSIANIGLKKHYLYPIKSFNELQEEWSNEVVDPYSSITSSLSKVSGDSLSVVQIHFSPTWDQDWKKWAAKTYEIISSNSPQFLKDLRLSKYYVVCKTLGFPFIVFWKLLSLVFSLWQTRNDAETPQSIEEQKDDRETIKVGNKEMLLDKDNKWLPNHILGKIRSAWFLTDMNILIASNDHTERRMAIKEIISTLWVYDSFGQNWLKMRYLGNDTDKIQNIKNRTNTGSMILNSTELAGLVHFPTNYVKTPYIHWVKAKNFEPPTNLPIIDDDLTDDYVPESVLTPIGKTNFRGTDMSFWVGPSDRRRHIYIVWKTWMWKSTLLENMIVDDIRQGRWVAVIDPHGDLAENIIGLIPKNRTNQTIIFDPSDKQWPIAFNMFDGVDPEQRPLVASWIVGIFKKIFWDSWWPRLEHILRNTVLALLEMPNSTLISIPLMLTSEVYRNKVVARVKDPVVKKFWTWEFAKMAPNQKVEATWPILNKVWQFLSSTILRNVLGQPKNTFSVRWAMDNQKIVIVNLSKWKIWEDASALLWAMMVTKFQMDAMARSDMKEKDRRDFYLYVDEFQNFATDSFATILSEARKYKLNLVMANQYIGQMSEEVAGAVFWNVWSTIAFQVWVHDAETLKDVLGWEVTVEDLTNLKKYTIYLKQLIDWMPSPVFSAATFPPYEIHQEVFESRYNKILQVSREKYAKPRDSVQDKIYKTIDDIEKQESQWEKKKEDFKAKKDAEKKKAHEERMAAQEEKNKA